MSTIFQIPSPALWQTCSRCTFIGSCQSAFPSSGLCPHPAEACAGHPHPPIRKPRLGPNYARWALSDLEAASIIARWQIGKPINESDILLLRSRIAWETATQTEGPLWLLMDICSGFIEQIQLDFWLYYGIDEARFMATLPDAFVRATHCATPFIMHSCIERGGSWDFCLLNILRFFLWGLLELKHLNLDSLSDAEFRLRFEGEWQRLMAFRGTHFDFQVIPVLSFDHFVRYQALPHGDEFTRRTLSHYLVHQFCGYPHPIATAAPLLTEVAFGHRLREFYRPLLASTARKAWQRLDLRAESKQERDDIQREVDSAFDTFLKDFDFLAHRPSGLTQHGMLGMNEEPELQSLLDEVAVGLGFSLRSPDLAEVPFAHYIEQKMKFWLEERYPQTPAEILTANTDRLMGPDGSVYLTIRGAAREFGLSVDQLRRMDKSGSFPALRARAIWTHGCPYPPLLRLYPDTPASRHNAAIAADRAQTHSSSLSGQELNRQQAALALGVSEKKLRVLEDKKQVCPTKRGRCVVYTPEVIQEARKLLTAEK